MSNQLVAHDFALLPALLAQAGMADLIPANTGVATGSAPAEALPIDGEYAASSGVVVRPAASPVPAEPALRLESAAPALLDGDTPGAAAPGDEPPAQQTDMSRLLAELAAAGRTLAELARRDEQDRRAALEDLARYDAVAATCGEAERARQHAEALRAEAEVMAAAAFGDEVRTQAAHLVEVARRAEAEAARYVSQQEAHLRALGERPEVRRVLAERARRQEAERAAAEAAARAAQRADAITTARVAADAGWLDEARRVLASVCAVPSDDQEIAALLTDIAEREVAVRVAAARRALYAVRHELRPDPEAAVARLAALEVDGLPYDLSCRIFGEWSRACLRVCRARGIAQPLRYAPRQGRGAVLAPITPSSPETSPGTTYTVVSVLGLGGPWQPGRVVDGRFACDARPLRAG